MGLIPLFFVVKLGLYAAWCRTGVRWLGSAASRRPWTWSTGLAVARLLAGAGAGLGLGALLMGSGGEAHGRLGFNPWIWYGAVGLIRWILWSGVSAALQGRAAALWIPSGRRDLAWRGLGWLLSLGGDALALGLGLALGGLPC